MGVPPREEVPGPGQRDRDVAATLDGQAILDVC